MQLLATISAFAIMKVFHVLVFLFFIQCALGQTTLKVNKLLSRKKRYLIFPKGANFIYSFINAKILMLLVPRYVVVFNEWVVPFPLPSDLKELRDLRRKHRVHRRYILENLEINLARYGLNGTACVNRMICEAREFLPVKGKSLIKDMLYAVFSYPEIENMENNKYTDSCDASNFEECTAPLLHLMLGSFNNY